MSAINDLTIVYYTCNKISDFFATNVSKNLIEAAGAASIICVSQKPLSWGIENILVDLPQSHLNIYRQALIGAKAATTKYVAFAEDDVLYSPAHFKHRPSAGKFAYNLGTWNLFTWSDPLFTHKERRNMHGLICERELFIEAMEERFAAWPDDTQVNLGLWAEPGKYERQLGVTARESELFYTNPPNIVFSHKEALGFQNLGTRKRLGELRATVIPYWGSANKMMELYREV